MRRVWIRALQVLWAGAVAGGVLELFLRLTVPWQPGYYDVRRDPGHTVRYAYGEYKTDPWGFADDRPAPGDRRRRVAWIGDSVLYGVGCPQDRRLTERLEAADPAVVHLNLGSPGFSGDPPSELDTALNLAGKLGASRAVWLFNLNDVMPPKGREPDGWRLRRLPFQSRLSASYLWSSLDATVMAFQVRWFQIVPLENQPERNAPDFQTTADRVRAAVGRFERARIPLRVVIVPYEMQISAEAEAFYADAGVAWEDGFVGGSAQRALIERLEGIDVVDALPAFVGPDRRREDNALGEYFVATGGGRLDWNHLNPAGHARLADWLVSSGWQARLFE